MKQPDVPVGLAMGSLGFLLAGFGPYLLLLGGELHRSSAGLVWLSSAFGVGLLVVAATGPVLMRAGAGVVLRVAALTVAVGAASMAATPLLAVAGTGALLVGFGGAALVLVTPALIRGRTAAARLTRVNGVSSVAGILGPVSIGALEHAGVHGRLALLAPLPALVLLASWRRVPAPPADQPSGGRPGGVRVAVAWARVVLAVSGEFCFLVWGAARIRDVGVSGAAAAALSAAFTVGMAVGRLLGPRLAGHPLVVPGGALTAMVGTGLGALGGNPWTVTAGLGVAGLGIAVLYPVTLARLAATPGLAARHSAALGASASGTAILAAPAVLAVLGDLLTLRVAFLLPIPLLALLVAI